MRVDRISEAAVDMLQHHTETVDDGECSHTQQSFNKWPCHEICKIVVAIRERYPATLVCVTYSDLSKKSKAPPPGWDDTVVST